VHLYTVCDAPRPEKAELNWDLFHFDGRMLLHGARKVALRPNQSVLQKTLALGGAMRKFGRDQVYLRIALSVEGEKVSEQTVFLAPPRFLSLPPARARLSYRRVSPTAYDVTVRSTTFLHAVAFDIPGEYFRASDNWFDLYPGEARTVRLTLDRPVATALLRKMIQAKSLVDTFA
jgi:beta-mannosidase